MENNKRVLVYMQCEEGAYGKSALNVKDSEGTFD